MRRRKGLSESSSSCSKLRGSFTVPIAATKCCFVQEIVDLTERRNLFFFMRAERYTLTLNMLPESLINAAIPVFCYMRETESQSMARQSHFRRWVHFLGMSAHCSVPRK